MVTHHQLSASVETVHWGYFDAALEPLLAVDSGDTITIQTVSGAPEYMPDPPLVVPAELRRIHETLQPELGPHIITGPVAVNGAEPGDRLDIEILDIRLDTDWGWNTHKPAIAALSDIADPWTQHLVIDRERMMAMLPWGGEIPLEPFFGVLATAPPPSMGRVSSKPPDFFGGNMDNKELRVGTVVSLPVHTAGAVFSVGDGHAAQGDGEVSLDGPRDMYDRDVRAPLGEAAAAEDPACGHCDPLHHARFPSRPRRGGRACSARHDRLARHPGRLVRRRCVPPLQPRL